MSKLFTRPWIGVLTILILFIILEILLFMEGFQNGFLNFDFISKFMILLVFFGLFVVVYKESETPIIPTIGGIVCILISNYIIGLNWLILLLIGIILDFLLLYFIKPSLNKEIIRNEDGIPSDDARYIVSDPTKPLQINVENAIRRFTPTKKHEYEIDYQNELYHWLSREFPVQYEIQKGSSRPDLIIKNIAIEIKGPTRNRELDTLTTKFLKYANHYPHFIIVLFDCSFSEGHFNEIYSGIKQFAPHVKIIRK